MRMITIVLVGLVGIHSGGCSCKESGPRVQALTDASGPAAEPLAILPTGGGPAVVARGFEHLSGGREFRVADDLRADFASQDWREGDRVAFAGTCSGGLPSCGGSCVKIGAHYRTLTQVAFWTCEGSAVEGEVCWTSFKTYCKERWYRDSACTDEISEMAANRYEFVCD